MALSTLVEQRARLARCLTCLAALLTVTCGATHAGNRHYSHRGADGVVIFSDTPVVNGKLTRRSYTSFVRKPVVANPCLSFTKAQLEARGHQLDSQIARVASDVSVDPALIKAIARAESCFDASAVSHAGAKGLMQLMPATASAMGVKNILDLEQNLNGGARYFAAMLSRYSDNIELALAAYNAGPGNVDKYNGVPPFPETQRYIASVNRFRARYSPHFAPVDNALTPDP